MTLRLAGGVVLLVGLAGMLSGCGNTTAEDKNAKESLIAISDLPAGAKIADPFPEPCGPIPTLEAGNTKVAVTKPLEFESVVMREALGVFPESELAASAYEELTNPERTECIRASLEELGSAERVKTEPPASFDVGDENSDQQFRSIGSTGSTRGTVDAVTLRSGACLVTLIFISEEDAQDGVQEVSETAGGLLSDDC